MKRACLCILLAAVLAGCAQSPAAPTRSSPASTSASIPFDAMDFLTAVQVSQAYTRFDWEDASSKLDLEEVTRLVNQAASSPLPEEETGGLTRNEFWWATMETGEGILEANVLAGPQQEGIVYFCYTDAQGNITDFYANAPELALMLRQCSRREGEVDLEMLSLVQKLMEEKVQAMCQEYNASFAALEGPEFTGGQVAELSLLRNYDDLTEGRVSLYTLDLALTCNHPERIGLAGGIWVDDQGRLRNNGCLAYMVVVERENIIEQVRFLADDEMAATDDQTIRECLSWVL